MITKENVGWWLNTKDPVLVSIAESLIGEDLSKTEEDLTEILTFINVFSLGCREMGLIELANKYKWRSDTFVIGLKQLGYSSGGYKSFVLNKWIPGPIKRIIFKASNRATYRMLDLSRNLGEIKEFNKK